MNKSPEIEEYLETLVRYKEEGKEPKVKNLANDLGISAASVSEMLNKLSKKELIEYQSYGKIKLTKKGEQLGKSVLRKHRVVEKFLAFIGVKKGKIHEEACVLEHAISDDVERALKKTISSGKNKLGRENLKRLIDMKKDEKGTILFVDGGKNVCQRLNDMGLTPGTTIIIGRASTRIGPVEVCIRSSCLAIGRGLASKVFVTVKK